VQEYNAYMDVTAITRSARTPILTSINQPVNDGVESSVITRVSLETAAARSFRDGLGLNASRACPCNNR